MTSITYNEIEMSIFLERYKDKQIIYIPNPGNAGDALIVYGTWTLFDKLNLNYTIGNIKTKYTNKILFYAGGGNLVGLYGNCRDFFKNNMNNNEIVLLPHTITNEDTLIKNFNENIIIFCREKISYDYVFNLMQNKNNLYLSKDMALYTDNLDEYKLNESLESSQVSGELNCYRTDKEKTKIKIPLNNNDLSITLKKPGLVDNKIINKQVVNSLFNYISKYEIINTNRLHIAIAGCLLNKKVKFYNNSYYKNKAMYDYCLSKYEKLEFINK